MFDIHLLNIIWHTGKTGPRTLRGPRTRGPYEDPGRWEDPGPQEDSGPYEDPGPQEAPGLLEDSGPQQDPELDKDQDSIRTQDPKRTQDLVSTQGPMRTYKFFDDPRKTQKLINYPKFFDFHIMCLIWWNLQLKTQRTAVNTYYFSSCKNRCYNCYMQLTDKQEFLEQRSVCVLKISCHVTLGNTEVACWD